MNHSLRFTLVGALLAGCAVQSTGDEPTTSVASANEPPGLDVPRTVWTRVGNPWAARKIAACSDGRLYALNYDRSLYVNRSGGIDSAWVRLPNLGATQEISCANNQLVAFNDDRTLYQNVGTDTAPNWKVLGRPWAANQIGAGTELDLIFPSPRYFALNDDKSFWSSTDGGGWTQIDTLGATARIAGAGGYLQTRVFALNNDNSLWVNTGEGRSGYWHGLPTWGMIPGTPLIEISARSDAFLYGLDSSYNLWSGTTVKLDVLDRLDMPASNFVPTTEVPYDYPSNSTMAWTYILEGVTHDTDNWYVTGQYQIAKIPVDHDLNDHSLNPSWGYLQAGIPTALTNMGYNHLGQPAYANGLVYVPLEGSENVPMVVVYDTNLNVVTWTALPTHGITMESPWLGINPVDGLLYTSNFQIAPSNPIRAYKMTWATSGPRTLTLTQVNTFPLFDEGNNPLTIDAVGGGAFSSNGHLYMSSDMDGHVHGFDPNGTRKKIFGVDYTGHGSRQELEGLTIWDLDDGRSPNVRGELHLVMSKRDTLSLHFNSIYFKHYELTDPRDKTKL